MKDTTARDQAMANIRACLSEADARFARTRDTLNAPLVIGSVSNQSLSLSYTQATQLNQMMQGIKASAAIQARVNEQIAVYNLPFPSLKMAELATLSNTLLTALAQYRRHLARTAPTLLNDTETLKEVTI